MRRRCATAGLLALCAVACGTGEAGRPPAAADGGKETPQDAPPPAAQRALFRLAGRDAARSDAVGPRLAGAGQRIVNNADTELALDLDADVRAVLAPRTELWALEAAHSFLLLSGQVSVQRAPAPARSGYVPARLATAAGTLTLTGPADFGVRSEFSAEPLRARTQLAWLHGSFLWSGFTAADTLERVTCLPDASPPPVPAPLQIIKVSALAAAEQQFLALPPARVPEDTEGRLVRALLELANQRAQSDVLLARVGARRGVHGPDAAHEALSETQVRAFQRELAALAQRRHAQQELVLLAAEQSLLAVLARCGTPAPPPAGCSELAHWAQTFGPQLRGAF
ncbi:MAG: hypothetical protein RL701_1648 [Pseudomonadota bacterium]